MSRSLIAGTLAACALLLVLAVPPLAGAQREHEATPLGQAMDVLKSNLKVLARTAADPDHEGEALEALSAMQAAVLQAKAYDPQNLLEKPEAEREAHRKAFRADMLALLQELAGLEIDLLAGRRDEVVGAIKGPLMEHRNAAHRRFQTKE